MRARGAVVKAAPGKYEVIDLEVDDPWADELRVRLVASGLCHSDDHVATGDFPVGVYPFCGGHEGAGIVEAVGPGTSGWAVGDHVVFSMIPGCGRCRWCSTGQQMLCENGDAALTGARAGHPGSYRMRTADGAPVGQMCGISTFAEYTTVAAASAIKVEDDLPLEKLCLLGCGVGTGWGSAVNAAEVQPGHTTIIMGAGGIGANAVQGAAHVGAAHIIAVDPVEFKRASALQFGATHAFAGIAEATEFARSVTNGQGADSAIVTIGVVTGQHVAEAFSAIRKGGTVVVTGLGNAAEIGIPVSLTELTVYAKRIQGALYGQCVPTWDIPRQIAMYRNGRLKLDELITREYSLDAIAQGYEDLHAGDILRGVVRY
jgi:S-(hydroxymethyl)glutathione dehydrogenase/alcohol dehydrogenase